MANQPKNPADKYTVENGEIVMRFPILPRLSKKGISMLLATTSGAETFTYEGMEIKANVNLYVPIAQWEAKAKKSK